MGTSVFIWKHHRVQQTKYIPTMLRYVMDACFHWMSVWLSVHACVGAPVLTGLCLLVGCFSHVDIFHSSLFSALLYSAVFLRSLSCTHASRQPHPPFFLLSVNSSTNSDTYSSFRPPVSLFEEYTPRKKLQAILCICLLLLYVILDVEIVNTIMSQISLLLF